MKTNHNSHETPIESTVANNFDPFNDEHENEFSLLENIEIMDLRDVTRLIDESLIYLHNPNNTNSYQRELHKKQLIDSATELASHILSKESCKRLEIKAKVLDSQSFNHPPIREDIFHLAEASEALHDDSLRKAYETAIDELPDSLSTVKLRGKRALSLLKSGKSNSFFHAYAAIELKDNNEDTEGRKIMASHANRFLDFGKLEEGIDYNDSLNINDEHLERLVTPVPTSFNGKYGTYYEPRVEFYSPKHKTSQQVLADSAIDNILEH